MEAKWYGNSDLINAALLVFLQVAVTAAVNYLLSGAAHGANLNYSSSDIGYDIAETMRKMVTGPIGAAVGVGAVGFGAWRLFEGNWTSAIPIVLGGVMLFKAESIATTLGAII